MAIVTESDDDAFMEQYLHEVEAIAKPMLVAIKQLAREQNKPVSWFTGHVIQAMIMVDHVIREER